MTHLIAQARTKYGEAVYDKTVSDLAKEFGNEAFPSWITRFTTDLSDGISGPAFWLPLPDISEDAQLWEITESFCYKDNTCAYENCMTPEEKAYFKVFSDALRY
jgi:hypothetical protein